MKRIYQLVAMAIALLALSACSEEFESTDFESIDFVGTWNVIEFHFEHFDYGDDPSMPLAQTMMHAEYGPLTKQPRVMSFNSDGTGLDDDSLWGTSVSFTWNFQEDRLTLRATEQPYDNLPFEVLRKWNKVILHYNDFQKDSSESKNNITVEPGSGYTHPLGTSCEIIIKKSGK